MSNLKEKLTAAKATYESAHSALKLARSTYENGAGKVYAEMKKNIQTLETQIAEYEQSGRVAKDALAKALSASNGKITPQAKEALAARRDTDDLLDECRILLSQVEKNMVTERFSFSEAAETYRLAYQNASKRWAEMNTFTVLVECGERICAAMAVCTMTKAYDHHEKIANDRSESSNVILGELQELLRTFNGDKKPYIAELGTYDIGLMSENEIMSPAEMHMARSTIVTQ